MCILSHYTLFSVKELILANSFLSCVYCNSIEYIYFKYYYAYTVTLYTFSAKKISMISSFVTVYIC